MSTPEPLSGKNVLPPNLPLDCEFASSEGAALAVCQNNNQSKEFIILSDSDCEIIDSDSSRDNSRARDSDGDNSSARDSDGDNSRARGSSRDNSITRDSDGDNSSARDSGSGGGSGDICAANTTNVPVAETIILRKSPVVSPASASASASASSVSSSASGSDAEEEEGESGVSTALFPGRRPRAPSEGVLEALIGLTESRERPNGPHCATGGPGSEGANATIFRPSVASGSKKKDKLSPRAELHLFCRLILSMQQNRHPGTTKSNSNSNSNSNSSFQAACGFRGLLPFYKLEKLPLAAVGDPNAFTSFADYRQFYAMMIAEECRCGIEKGAAFAPQPSTSTTGSATATPVRLNAVVFESGPETLPPMVSSLMLPTDDLDSDSGASAMGRGASSSREHVAALRDGRSRVCILRGTVLSTAAPGSGAWNQAQAAWSPQNGDLVLVSLPQVGAADPAVGSPVMGMVMGWDPDLVEGCGVEGYNGEGGTAFFRMVLLTGDGLEDEGTSPWAPRALVRSVVRSGASAQLTVVGNVITSCREFQALGSLNYADSAGAAGALSPMQQFLTNPRTFLAPPAGISSLPNPTSSPCTGNGVCARPSNIPAALWRKLRAAYNPSQLRAICAVCGTSAHANGTASAAGSASMEERLEARLGGIRISLVQGPPGTGKTSTIMGLVSVLLAPGCFPELASDTAGPSRGSTSIKVGASLSRPKSESAHVALADSNPNHHTPKVRILICAPSNIAIDEIIFRLKVDGAFTNDHTERRNKGLSIVRIGHGAKAGAHSQERWAASVDHFASRVVDPCSFDALVEAQKKLQSERAAAAAKRAEPGLFRGRRIPDTEIRRRVLAGADVICSTLSGAASQALLESTLYGTGTAGSGPGLGVGARVRTMEKDTFGFDAVIVDESCQAVEPSTLIPFKYLGPRSVLVLLGDPCQLAPVVLGRLNDSLKHKHKHANADACSQPGSGPGAASGARIGASYGLSLFQVSLGSFVRFVSFCVSLALMCSYVFLCVVL